ncbi:MAG: hypothetical protein R3F47_07700 [Gammaproteobacteria bacterium]
MDSPSSYPGAVRFARSMHNPYTAWIILGVSLLLTVGAYHLSERFVQKRAEDRFHYRALELEHAITTRLYLYEQLLWSGVALMNASNTVDREDFRQFVNTMNIDRRWPGIRVLATASWCARMICRAISIPSAPRVSRIRHQTRGAPGTLLGNHLSGTVRLA